jgi:ParB-like chromosome segregation protein Spo0J
MVESLSLESAARKIPISRMNQKTLPIEDLVEDPDNLRMHPEENLTGLCASLAEFGQPEPLIVRKSNKVVISGNGRLAAMKRLGWKEAKVIIVDWDDARSRAYSLVANRTAETARWTSVADVLLTVEELRGDVDITAMGFDPEQFAKEFSYDPREVGEPEESQKDPNRPKHGKPVQLTQDQRKIFDQACAQVRQNGSEDYSEGRCLELMVADYLAGA